MTAQSKFKRALAKVMSVSREEMQRRLEADRQKRKGTSSRKPAVKPKRPS